MQKILDPEQLFGFCHEELYLVSVCLGVSGPPHFSLQRYFGQFHSALKTGSQLSLGLSKRERGSYLPQFKISTFVGAFLPQDLWKWECSLPLEEISVSTPRV